MTADVSRPRPRRRGRAWGVIATIVASIGILPIVLVFFLAATVDPLWGWMLFVALPFSIGAGAVGGVLGIIGLVVARSDGGGYAWPAAGLVLGAVQVVVANGWLDGWLV
ncbi:hypothetical protein [Microbacterium sp. cf332]|uniref:hypothetical protein n=1 Tax=Microbacterium sp. cf332 TaxID=1761804 RepID=UPI00088EBCA5|nr:hypothetical protein [Microbacterium sp. cf332]SDQ25808.1 hypothetical protein SAMN04487847_1110 [Microbacterium sp. cf332]